MQLLDSGKPDGRGELRNATLKLTPVTDGNKTFAEWWAEFDCAPEKERRELAQGIGQGVFQAASRFAQAEAALVELDAHKRLREAQQAAIEGRHAEALRGYEWFHRNALRHQRSLYGVRLSFALWYWVELGKVYPKARRSLERIRRYKTAALRDGRGDRETFHDVVSINDHLDKQRDTYRLFVNLDGKRPALAAKCAGLAMPALVRHRDVSSGRSVI